MGEVVIWIIREGGSYRVGVSDAKAAPIPFGADPVTCIKRCDERMMLEWIKKRIKRGWSPEKIRTAC